MRKKPSIHFIKKKTNLVVNKKTHLAEKPSLIDDDIAEISQRIMEELETASSKDLSDAKYAKKILQLSDLHHTKRLLQEIESVSPGAEHVIEKKSGDKGIAAFYMVAETLFYYQDRYYVDPRRGRYIPLHIVL